MVQGGRGCGRGGNQRAALVRDQVPVAPLEMSWMCLWSDEGLLKAWREARKAQQVWSSLFCLGWWALTARLAMPHNG